MSCYTMGVELEALCMSHSTLNSRDASFQLQQAFLQQISVGRDNLEVDHNRQAAKHTQSEDHSTLRFLSLYDVIRRGSSWLRGN